MRFNPDVFKAYDVRGLYPQEISEDLFRQLGRMAGAPAVWNAVLEAAADWDGPVPGRDKVRIVETRPLSAHKRWRART